jgi:hypothetical protein
MRSTEKPRTAEGVAMKLFEHPENVKTLDRLPDLPEGVEVPDDASGLDTPTAKKPTTGGVRWMRWLTAIVLLLGAAGLITAMVLRGDNADQTQDPVDYMQMYGTDNPAFVEGSSGPGTVEILAPARPFMELYGTDNPVFVPQADVDPVDTGEFMRLYGTDNPEFLPEPSPMELYGTDNPTIIEP